MQVPGAQTFATPPAPHASPGTSHRPQSSEPPQPSAMKPHVFPSAGQVVGTQVEPPAVPPAVVPPAELPPPKLPPPAGPPPATPPPVEGMRQEPAAQVEPNEQLEQVVPPVPQASALEPDSQTPVALQQPVQVDGPHGGGPLGPHAADARSTRNQDEVFRIAAQ